MKKLARVIAVVLALGLAGVVCAQPAAASVKPAATVSEVRTAAERGDAKAQNMLGEMYRDGQGVVRDDAQATAWFRKAAAGGDTGAQDALRELSGP